MSVYKRGRVYWYDFWRKGKRYQASTGCTIRRDAETIEHAKKTEIAMIAAGVLPPREPAPPRQSDDQRSQP